VWRTRVGYAGGKKKNPTYHDLGDHTETFQVDFDPKVISYETLLDLFWKSHNPCGETGSRQYMSAVFWASEEQRKLAEAGKAEIEKDGREVTTPIMPLGEFTVAEDYHQKWNLRNARALGRTWLKVFPKDEDLMNSTAAMRANAWLGGDLPAERLKVEIGRYGMTEAEQALLKDALGD
jgi:methionine-S-sulfoxide reductase